ncbi:MAG: DNA polymerase III subunit epsilon [Alphaproteobacteria bacterium]
MREIVMDTETTGLRADLDDRLIEIGCVEIVNNVATGKTLHLYCNPERDVPEEAVAVHGITTEFVKDKPLFSEIAGEFLDFIGDDPLVIHNAPFDVGFLDMELQRLGLPKLDMKRVVDTLQIARTRFPGAPSTLDALCRRFGIDNSSRELHGALLDSELLAEVYLELRGGRQPGLELAADGAGDSDSGGNSVGRMDIDALIARAKSNPRREPRTHAPNAEEAASHAELVSKLKDPVWQIVEMRSGKGD